MRKHDDEALRRHLERGLAYLSALWQDEPKSVAERLKISYEADHIIPAEIKGRFERAAKKMNRKRQETRGGSRKKPRPIVQASASIVETYYKELKKELVLFVKSRYEHEIEDIIQEALVYVCQVPRINSYENAIKVAKKAARNIIRARIYRKAQLPFVSAPEGDFYTIEELYSLFDETEYEDEAQFTADLYEALRRIAAELINILGKKQAASALGMQERTFDRFFSFF